MPAPTLFRRLLTSAFRTTPAATVHRRVSPLGPGLERLEDRATPAVTASLVGGVLTVTLGANGDAATVTGTAAGGTSISVSGTGYAGQAFADVTAIEVVGAGTGQSVLVTTSGGSVALAGDLTVAVGGSVRLGASPADAITAARVTATATGAVAVDGVVTATAAVSVPPTAGPPPGLPGDGFPLPTLSLQSATTGNGFVTFGAGSRLNADAQLLRAGTGAWGAGAQVAAANGAFRGRTGAAAPAAFWFAQDSTINDAAVPAASQFGGATPAYYAVNSTDGFLTLATAAKASSSTHLTLASAAGVLISAPLIVDSLRTAGSAFLQGGAVTTTGAAGQAYTGPVDLVADATLAAGAGPVTFADTVSGGYALTVNSSGATTFGGAVGGTPLASLRTDAGGTTAIDGGAVNTTGTQAYGDPVTLGAASTTLTASTASFADDLTLGASAAAATSGLRVTGSLALGSGTTLATTLAGSAAFGAVAVTGSVAYGGATLAVSYSGGPPAPGTTFAVVTGGAAGTGQFANAPVPAATLAGDSYRVTYAGGAGGHDFVLTRADPTTSVTSIARTTPAGPTTNATSVTYAVTFSGPVTGVDPSDFELALSGVTAATPVAVSGSGATYTVTVSGISGTGTLGLNLVDDGTIRDTLGHPLAPAGGPASFAPHQAFATGAGPQSVAVADVNGDGTPDLTVANVFSNTVGVLLGNGDGTFQPQQTFAAGTFPNSVAVADVNGDGKPDLAVTNGNDDTVGVLLGNGDGTFQPQQAFATGPYGGPSVAVSGPHSVAVADVNADGTPDLAVANELSNTAAVLLGNGDGTFQPDRTFPTGGTPFSVAVADVNGDGAPDLAVANGNGASVSVLLGNGDGTFQPQQAFPTGSGPFSVAVADVNGDSKPDLAVANFGSNTVGVLLGNGDGTFQPQQALATGAGPRAVAVADVNGDGKPDLAVASSTDGTVGVLLGNGDGTFAPQQTFAAGTFPNSVAVADVNGDGKPDLAVTSAGDDTAGVLLNAANGDFTGEVYAVDTVAPGATITSTAGAVTGTSPIPVTVTFDEAVTGFTADDVVVTNGTVSGFTGSGTTYTFDVVPAGDGRVTVDVPAGAAQDAAGNGSTAAAHLTRTFSSTGLAIIISPPSLTVVGAGATVTYTVTYADTLSDPRLRARDVRLNRTGSARGTVAVEQLDASTFRVTVSDVRGDGTLGISIRKGTATDPLGRKAPGAGPSETFVIDAVPPAVTLRDSRPRSRPKHQTVVLDVTVTDASLASAALDRADVAVVSRTGISADVAVDQLDATHFRVTLTNFSAAGRVRVALPPGIATDAVGNASEAVVSRRFRVVPGVTV